MNCIPAPVPTLKNMRTQVLLTINVSNEIVKPALENLAFSLFSVNLKNFLKEFRIA